MRNFAIKKIPELQGKQKFYKLLINGNAPFDEFVRYYKDNPNMRKELEHLQRRLEFVADCRFKALPPQKYRELTGRKGNDPHKDYEVKSKHLGIYFFKDDGTGQIIVLGGTKKTQQKDIQRMRKIKLEYFKSKEDV